MLWQALVISYLGRDVVHATTPAVARHRITLEDRIHRAGESLSDFYQS